ncbi:MAG: class I SAM-dependent methyltransferase [Caulobacterales bacterium]
MIDDIPAFIAANTRVLSPPHTPELRLHLADNAVALWQLTEDELGALGLPPPFWAFAWAGGQAIARYILDQPALVQGKTVLDVASGSGLVAIAAMRAGAFSARAIDLDPFATQACLLNAALNAVSIEVETGNALLQPAAAQVILVGDLFYEKDLAAALLSWLQAQAAAGKTVLIGDPGRAYLPKDALVRVAEYAIPVSRDLEDCEVKRTAVWRLA